MPADSRTIRLTAGGHLSQRDRRLHAAKKPTSNKNAIELTTLLPIILQRAAPTASALVFGWNAFDTVKAPQAEGLPWDWYVHWLALALGILVVWLAMSVVCAGVRLAALRLHRVPRWTAYLGLVLFAYAVPTLLLIPQLAAMTVCWEGSCDVSANMDGLGIMIPMLIRPNLVTWTFIAPLSVAVAAWMAHMERRLAGGRLLEDQPRS